MIDRTKVDQWCDAVLEAGWLAALVVTPLFFNVFSSRVFEPDKISLVRTIALIMSVAWLAKVANGGFAWLPAASTSPDQRPQDGNWYGFVRNPFFVPVFLLVMAYLISTVSSVAVFVSWFGSYQRLQGTYTFLAYVTIAGLTAATLRRAGQLRRLQHAVIITSLPIAIYGVIQHYNLDPLPWGGDVQTRVAGNAGNAIFLAAYLIMAFFLTLERVFTSFVRLLGIGQPADAELQDWQTSLAGGAYLFILLVQSIAIVWTQSRGPWLGWGVGIYLFALLTVTVLRPRYFKALTIVIVALGITGSVTLAALNTEPARAALGDVPYVGRLTRILDLDEGTNRVRVLIWQGASQMVAPHEPLTFPDSGQDALNVLRPLIGYGPEAMWVAFNPFYPPDLAHIEARNASPDRSHNETWDSIVITGIFGFLAYMSVFVSIFYWSLRWLGLIKDRRDTVLFGALLGAAAVIMSVIFYFFDDNQLRLFGVALPTGLTIGLVIYITIAAFLRAGERPGRSELARQMLLITLLTAIIAHFLEIHLGIAIAATRTHFWIFTAVLMLVGMNQVQLLSMEMAESSEEPEPTETAPAAVTGKRRKGGKGQPMPRRARRSVSAPALVPATILSDVLIFLTLVYIYTTNAAGNTDPVRVLFESVSVNPKIGAASPAILFLLFFTWMVAVTVGLAEESVSHRQAPGTSWWASGVGLHAAIVWLSWFIYGLFQATRLAPPSAAPGMTNQEYLNLQLERIGGHFGVYTAVVILWILVAATVYAWPHLRTRGVQASGRWAAGLVAGVASVLVAGFLILTVNVTLVKADIVYKQGQQFDAQGNWLSSIELYKRALATRKTEDHYMLFLGRAVLEQAKQAPDSGSYQLPAQPTLDDVLNLTPDQVGQMSRQELLRAAEVVLMQAQNVNPLNTDHTANLARLYRTWADIMANDPAVREEMLAKSVAMYDKAVTLSPNAAHLWNERGNALLAQGKSDQARASYEHSLELDNLFDQTYLLMADFLERTGQSDELIRLLNQGIDAFVKIGNQNATAQLLSYLSVALAREGDLEGAAAANLKMLQIMPGNTGALRNLAVIARDQEKYDEALDWTQQAIALTDPGAISDLKILHQLAAEIYERQGNTAGAIAEFEIIRQLDPGDTIALQTLSNFYNAQGNDAKVVEIAQALMQVDPNNYQHPLNAAQALLRLDRTAEAIPYLDHARQLAPADQQAAIDALLQQATGS
ncbi:MAG: O-antigen ligase family protein [Caldilineaceae bacterium]|nr:O-antigen ligase family protein [Caldilineaceae bacterium]